MVPEVADKLISQLINPSPVNLPHKGKVLVICSHREIESFASWLRSKEINFIYDGPKFLIYLDFKDPFHLEIEKQIQLQSELEKQIEHHDINIETNKIRVLIHEDETNRKIFRSKINTLLYHKLTPGYKKAEQPSEYLLTVWLPFKSTRTESLVFMKFITWLMTETKYHYEVCN